MFVFELLIPVMAYLIESAIRPDIKVKPVISTTSIKFEILINIIG